MITQKAALVGCRSGPWISTANMKNQQVRIEGPAGVIVRIDHKTPEFVTELVGAGVHDPLKDSDWMRLSVVEGAPDSVLGFVMSGGSRD